MVQCDQTSAFASSIMLPSEEVRRPLHRPVQLPLTREVQHGNRIDCSFGGIFARWRGLGILSLSRLARLQDERLATLLLICGAERSKEIDPRTLFQVPLN